MQATVRLEHELLAVESEHDVWCMLELSAPPPPQRAERRPLAIGLVIDRSGSMSGRKLEVTRSCAAFLVQRLAPADQLAIVAYDDEVRLLAPLVRVADGREALLDAIAQIHPGGSTNLSGGYLKGAETLAGADPEALRRVLLLSDGLANVGITDVARLRQLAARMRETAQVTTSTIGFGADFDEDLMTAMADAGGGTAHFAETPEDAPGVFGREFSDLVSVVAQNVSVEIRPEAAVEMLGVLGGFPVVPVPGGVQVQVGDAYGDEHRRVVFRLHVPGLAVLGPHRVAEVVLRYVSVGAEIAHHEVRLPVTVNAVSSDEAAAAVPDARVTEEVVLLTASEAGKRARALADAGDLEGARLALEEAAMRIEAAAPGSERARELEEEIGFLRASALHMAEGLYHPALRKRLTYRTRATDQGRRRRT